MKIRNILLCAVAILLLVSQAQAAMTCYLIGKVTNPDGAPVEGATVTTHRDKAEPPVTTVKSLATGKFITSVPGSTSLWIKTTKDGLPTSWSLAPVMCSPGGWSEGNIQMK